MIIASATSVAICLHCGHLMRLVRTVPKVGALPEFLVFRCPSCNEVDTIEGAASDTIALVDADLSTVA